MKRVISLGMVMLFVFTLVFSFTFVLDTPAAAGNSPCCTIPPSPGCSAGKGYWDTYLERCIPRWNEYGCEVVTPVCW